MPRCLLHLGFCCCCVCFRFRLSEVKVHWYTVEDGRNNVLFLSFFHSSYLARSTSQSNVRQQPFSQISVVTTIEKRPDSQMAVPKKTEIVVWNHMMAHTRCLHPGGVFWDQDLKLRPENSKIVQSVGT